ncbi:hypothetical protein B0H11DRAFT_2001094 [Mycena galericulata]|nr:hypothetical protein B0H11DRAFT_2001094 [Mycena galericulata]
MALSPTAVGWHQIGIGLRRAQDVGAHRRKIQLTPTAENEQWKRVFWVLLTLEWMYGTHSGRPLVMHDQDYDQELPIECDDDYWDLPEPHNFKQPKGKPSSIAYFNCHVKLLEIQAAITTTLYSPRKPTNLSCRPSPLTDSQAIVSFDSALNSWFSQIPDHLRWDSERKNQQHFNQSALLYTTYYNVLILLHRPFIPEPLSTSTPGERKITCSQTLLITSATAAQPSLVICTNAARSSARIFDAQHKRGTFLNVNQLAATFTAGIVLLLNIWTGRRSSVNCDPPKELDLVYKCVQAMGDIETSFYAAGRYHDVLNRLIHAGGSVDIMFQDFNSTKCRPPVAQHGAGSAASPLTQDPQSAAQWSYTFTRHHIEDLEHALHAILRSQIRVPDSRYSEGFPNGSGHLPHAVYDFEQSHEHTDMDSSIFSANMPVVDSDLMSMWSNAPVGFQYVVLLVYPPAPCFR